MFDEDSLKELYAKKWIYKESNVKNKREIWLDKYGDEYLFEFGNKEPGFRKKMEDGTWDPNPSFFLSDPPPQEVPEKISEVRVLFKLNADPSQGGYYFRQEKNTPNEGYALAKIETWDYIDTYDEQDEKGLTKEGEKKEDFQPYFLLTVTETVTTVTENEDGTITTESKEVNKKIRYYVKDTEEITTDEAGNIEVVSILHNYKENESDNQDSGGDESYKGDFFYGDSGPGDDTPNDSNQTNTRKLTDEEMRIIMGDEDYQQLTETENTNPNRGRTWSVEGGFNG